VGGAAEWAACYRASTCWKSTAVVLALFGVSSARPWPSNTSVMRTPLVALQERLEGPRSNLRFAEKRITDLEAELLEVKRSLV
jgi:hypothetical protein